MKPKLDQDRGHLFPTFPLHVYTFGETTWCSYQGYCQDKTVQLSFKRPWLASNRKALLPGSQNLTILPITSKKQRSRFRQVGWLPPSFRANMSTI